MSLTPGTTFGHCEVLESIGTGGMGEVYKARDIKLGRDVAIKVLPDAVAHDEERLARFEREAKLLTSLNHPAIATLHGLEDIDGTRFLVMELVEGETRAERTAREPIPIELTGRKAFDGDNVTDILAGVVKNEPDWKAFPASSFLPRVPL